jgi:hypothetical protein
MTDWMLPHIADYWDERVQAIDRLSRVLEAVPAPEQHHQLHLIYNAVRRHVDALSDEHVVRAAVFVADDLYKAASQMSYWDWALESYLLASAGTFFQAVRQRGFVVHYVVDNAYEDLTGPVRWFSKWYGQTGFQYVCPQHIAYADLILGGESKDDLSRPLDPSHLRLIPNHLRHASEVASELVKLCHEKGCHFIFLTTDSAAVPVAGAMDTAGSPGVVHVFRNQPPVAGSTCSIQLPPAPRPVASDEGA